PAGPDAPAAPLGPAGPLGPDAPAAPLAPCGPVAPAGPCSTICNCAGWLVAVFSLASMATLVAGIIEASNAKPLLLDGIVSQPFTSVVMSTPTHWPPTITGVLPCCAPI